ncbi:hypothetical protein [Streptomyces albus]|uniref:hypothetical protein n=1 Tax=Streptomyces sp. NRRL F-5917 TaxID=1463873 RepID=UPI0004C08CF9|nr:hypothetical protein [Streptomyces sp. NRRL F-5917]
MTKTSEQTAPGTEAQPEALPEALGAYRIAEALAEHTGAEVTAADVHELAERGLLAGPVDYYKKWPLYSTAAALALDVVTVRQVVEERRAWLAASVTRDEAAARTGWHWRDLARMAAEGRITTGRGGRT